MGILDVLISTSKIHILSKFSNRVSLRVFSTINKTVFFEGANKVGKSSVIRNTRIGYATYFGNENFICDSNIGKFCSIGDRVKIVVGKHPTSENISTHPSFYSVKMQSGVKYVNENLFEEYNKTESGYVVNIGNDVWIGSDVVILQGVNIGNGAIISSGSVVNKDVKDYEIVGGVPAKLIRSRFSVEEIKILNDLRWWDYKDTSLKEIAKSFSNPSIFFENIKNRNKGSKYE